jgi:hypothetical protein
MHTQKLYFALAASVAFLCSTFISAAHAQDDDTVRIERALTELRQAKEQVMKQLETARSEGAERKVAELEKQMAQIQEKFHGIELQAKNARQERQVEKRADQPARKSPEIANGLEHARVAEKHLRKAGLMDMADMVHHRIGEFEREITSAQAVRRDNPDARRAQEVRHTADARRQATELDRPSDRREPRETREPRAPRDGQPPREPANNERMGAALHEFQVGMREMRQEIEKLRHEMNELRGKLKD